MSNTLRRPRKRPRVKSTSFRTFGWLLMREVAFEVVRGTQLVGEHPRFIRELLAKKNTYQVVDLVARLLPAYEKWRRQ